MASLLVKGVADYQIPRQAEYGSALGRDCPVTPQVAWRGDRAVFPLTLLTQSEPVPQVTVTGTAFNAPEGEIAAEQVACTFLTETKAFVGNGKKDNGSRESFPDVLYTTQARDLPANCVQNVWVSISVPEEAAPGVYQGAVVVNSPALEQPVETAVTLEVLDLKLPQAKDYLFDIELWQYPYRVAQYYGLEPFCEAHFAVLREHLRYYTELGGHAITASIVEEPWNGQTYGQYPSMIRWRRDKNKRFHFDYTAFDQWVSFCKELGMGDKIVCYSLIPWGNKITFYDEKSGKMKHTAPRTGSFRYKRIWRQFLEALVAHTEEKGWFDQIYIGIDERRHMEKSFALIDSVKGKNGRSFKISAAMDHFSEKYFPIIDRMDAVSIGSHPAKHALPDLQRLIAHRNENPACKTTLYTCVGHFPNSFTYSMPLEGYWTMMFCGSQGTTGYLRWALDAWVKDPLRDTTHVSFEAGDCFLVYPDEPDAAAPVSKTSVRLEMLAKGLRDINKLYWLASQGEAWEVRVRALLSGIKPTYSQQHDGIADQKARTELPRDMTAFIDAMNQLFRAYIQ